MLLSYLLIHARLFTWEIDFEHGVTKKKNQQVSKAWVQIALAELAKSVKFIWVVCFIGLEKHKNGSSRLSGHLHTWIRISDCWLQQTFCIFRWKRRYNLQQNSLKFSYMHKNKFAWFLVNNNTIGVQLENANYYGLTKFKRNKECK